jgi:hypothetical protein
MSLIRQGLYSNLVWCLKQKDAGTNFFWDKTNTFYLSELRAYKKHF